MTVPCQIAVIHNHTPIQNREKFGVDIGPVPLIMQTGANIVLSVRLQTFGREVLGSNPGEVSGIYQPAVVVVCVCVCVFVIGKESPNNPLLSAPKLYATVHSLV